MAGSVSRGCTSGSRSLLLSLAQPKTRNSRRALVTRAIRWGLRSKGPPARHLEQTMPRYFFNIRSGAEYLANEEGDECPTLSAAGSRAVVGGASNCNVPGAGSTLQLWESHALLFSKRRGVLGAAFSKLVPDCCDGQDHALLVTRHHFG